MKLDDYQDQVAVNAVFSPQETPPGVYQALGLCGESGEVAEKIKKFWRDGGSTAYARHDICKELGDALWYLSETARAWDLKLSEVAQTNIDKLADRRARKVLNGAGDNR